MIKVTPKIALYQFTLITSKKLVMDQAFAF